MPTQTSQFKAIILKEISLTGTHPVSIEKLYSAALNTIDFDEHDLQFTILKNKFTTEPNWKRNLRNCLQGLKSSGELVNSSQGYWRLPSSNQETFLDPDEAWQSIKDGAHTALNMQSSWESVKQGHVYNVVSVDDKKIGIKRVSTNSVEQLYKSDVVRGINSLNAAGGRLGRRSMIYVVAKEVAIVQFHPDLNWDDEHEFLYVTTATKIQLINLVTQFEEANNDDADDFQTYARRIRKGQSKLRKKLLNAYNNMCCISKTGPENVLQAAHIEPHSEKGNNISTNALLLRSDLHDLFDDGLLLIDPSSLKVCVHPSLINTYYYKYNNEKLLDRTDNLRPDYSKLTEKWNKHYWI